MRGLVYTAIFGGHDKPLKVKCPEKNVDYLMFTDGESESGWEHVAEPPTDNPRMQARLRKIPIPSQGLDYDWVIWVDGSCVPQVPIAKHVEGWLSGKDFAAFRHPHRDCAYSEIRACRCRGKDQSQNLCRADEELHRIGFPIGYGMIATGVFARRVDSKLVRDHADLWSKWVETYTVRDQISVMVCLWELTDHGPAEDHLHSITGDIYSGELFGVPSRH